MKPPLFDYHAPTTLASAIELLGSLDNARVLAGGQSLMPMLNMRFAFPDHVIDLNRIDALAGITLDGDTLRIGAMTRQRTVEEHPVVRRRLPLLADALALVGHRQTRNRGTIGGSLCHMDPAAELVAVAVALDAVLDIAGPGMPRSIAAAAFPAGYMTPALAPDEILTAIRIPLPPERHGACFREFSRRHGDFAIVSAAALLVPGPDGCIAAASITIGGVGAAPVRLAEAEAMLLGGQGSAAAFGRAAELAGAVDAIDDPQVPAWYRRRLAAALTRRALDGAAARLAG